MDVLHRWSTAGGADHEVFAFVLSGRDVVLLVRQVVTASVGTALCDSEVALVGDRELQRALQGQAQSVERLYVGGVGDSDQQGVIVERPHGKSAVSMSEMLWQSKSDFFLDLFVEDVDERQVVLLAECQREVERRGPPLVDDDLAEPLPGKSLQLERAAELARAQQTAGDEDRAEPSA